MLDLFVTLLGEVEDETNETLLSVQLFYTQKKATADYTRPLDLHKKRDLESLLGRGF